MQQNFAAALSAAFFDHVRDAPFGGRLSQPQVDGLNTLAAAWIKYGDGDLHKLAYVLATAFHETAETMQPIYERGSRSYFDRYEPGTAAGRALGNTYPGDGYLFRGRGFVQLTGRANYAKAGLALKEPLTRSPDLALGPDLAARIAVLGMMQGWFTGKKLGDYIRPGSVDYVNARRVINGTDRASTIALYAANFERALKA